VANGGGINTDSRGFKLLRNSGFVGPHVLVTRHTWRAIADKVWEGKTVPESCKELGLDWPEVHKAMTTDIKRYMVDVSMLAGVREEYLSASFTTD
jgi:hypothetical protein